ncbi:hypothetical protein [Halalkalicoccus salilacus]
MVDGFERYPGLLLLLPRFSRGAGTSTGRSAPGSRAVSTRD